MASTAAGVLFTSSDTWPVRMSFREARFARGIGAATNPAGWAAGAPGCRSSCAAGLAAMVAGGAMDVCSAAPGASFARLQPVTRSTATNALADGIRTIPPSRRSTPSAPVSFRARLHGRAEFRPQLVRQGDGPERLHVHDDLGVPGHEDRPAAHRTFVAEAHRRAAEVLDHDLDVDVVAVVDGGDELH